MFGIYRPAPEDTAPAFALVDSLALKLIEEEEVIHQFEDQGVAADTSSHSDDGDLGIPPLPLVPTRSHDHEAGGFSVAPPSIPPASDPTLAAILQSITQ